MTEPSDQGRVVELQAILSDNIRKLQAGEMTPAKANRSAKAIGAELRAIQVRMRAARVFRKAEGAADKSQLIARP